MREIKFRGKRNNGKWAYGSLVYSPNIQPAIYFEMGVGAIKFFDWCYIDPASVGQYTGIKDKNGVEIYEGDIVRKYDLTFGLKWEGVVVYNDAIGCFRIHSENNDITLRMGFEASDVYNDGKCTVPIKYEYEVIGNIYSNE